MPEGSAVAWLLQQHVLWSGLAPSTPGNKTCVRNFKLHFAPLEQQGQDLTGVSLLALCI